MAISVNFSVTSSDKFSYIPIPILSLYSEYSSLASPAPTIPPTFSQSSTLGTSFPHAEQATNIHEITCASKNPFLSQDSPSSQLLSSDLYFLISPASLPANEPDSLYQLKNVTSALVKNHFRLSIHFHRKISGSRLGSLLQSSPLRVILAASNR